MSRGRNYHPAGVLFRGKAYIRKDLIEGDKIVDEGVEALALEKAAAYVRSMAKSIDSLAPNRVSAFELADSIEMLGSK